MRVLNANEYNRKKFIPKYAEYIVSLLVPNKNGDAAVITNGKEIHTMKVEDLEYIREKA